MSKIKFNEKVNIPTTPDNNQLTMFAFHGGMKLINSEGNVFPIGYEPIKALANDGKSPVEVDMRSGTFFKVPYAGNCELKLLNAAPGATIKLLVTDGIVTKFDGVVARKLDPSADDSSPSSGTHILYTITEFQGMFLYQCFKFSA